MLSSYTSRKKKENYPFPDLVVTPEMFETHCATLSKYYDTHILSEAVELLQDGDYHGRKPLAAITFDDGYKDNLIYAEPILNKYGLKATFYIISGLAGKQRLTWYDTLGFALLYLYRAGTLYNCLIDSSMEELFYIKDDFSINKTIQAAKLLSTEKRFTFISKLKSCIDDEIIGSELECIMSGEELTYLRNKGHEIGSHTDSHEILPLLDTNALIGEIENSKKKLEFLLKSPVKSFCYPNGDYNDVIIEAVKAAGFTYGCTTKKGNNKSKVSLYELRRWFIKEDSLITVGGKPSASLLRMELTGIADRIFFRNRVWKKQK